MLNISAQRRGADERLRARSLFEKTCSLKSANVLEIPDILLPQQQQVQNTEVQLKIDYTSQEAPIRPFSWANMLLKKSY